MTDGDKRPPGDRGLRPAIPHAAGPLAGSGAAPDPPAVRPAPQPQASLPASGTGSTATKADAAKAAPVPADAAKPGAAETDRTMPDPQRDDPQRDAAQSDDPQSDDPRRDDPRRDDPRRDDPQSQAGDPQSQAGDPKGGDAATVAGKSAEGDGTDQPAGSAAVPAGAGPSRPRGRTSRVLRRLRPRPVRAARSVAGWARSPVGRVIVPGLAAVLLIGGAGAAGAYLVPQALDVMPSPRATPTLQGQSADPGLSAAPGPAPVVGAPLGSAAPVVPPTALPTAPVPRGGRPADALAGWAQQVGTRVGVPVVAVQAYGYAELVLRRTAPACRLSWTTLAAIAKVESAHGSANGAVLSADGEALPAIVGLPLDGKGGRQLIKDTDQGALDGDRVYDRAMGPLQFVPTTWRENAVDADNNGVTDPNDIDDASLTAGMYLCRDGHDMSNANDWWDAILSYNNVRPYAQQVFTEANAYGQRSRT